jgi:hypothetical protein
MVRAMKLNTTFNNILIISWRSVLWVEETRVLVENHDLSQVTDKVGFIDALAFCGYESIKTVNRRVDI